MRLHLTFGSTSTLPIVCLVIGAVSIVRLRAGDPFRLEQPSLKGDYVLIIVPVDDGTSDKSVAPNSGGAGSITKGVRGPPKVAALSKIMLRFP
jgi:hypothetical protein